MSRKHSLGGYAGLRPQAQMSDTSADRIKVRRDAIGGAFAPGDGPRGAWEIALETQAFGAWFRPAAHFRVTGVKGRFEPFAAVNGFHPMENFKDKQAVFS